MTLAPVCIFWVILTWTFSRTWHSITFFLIIMTFFPPLRGLLYTGPEGEETYSGWSHWHFTGTRGPRLLKCSVNTTNFQSLPLDFPNYTLAAFNTSQVFNFLFLLSPPHHLISVSGCLSARGVWGQKGLLALVGLLRRLAPPPPLLPLCMLQHGMSNRPLVLHELTELLLFPMTKTLSGAWYVHNGVFETFSSSNVLF